MKTQRYHFVQVILLVFLNICPVFGYSKNDDVWITTGKDAAAEIMGLLKGRVQFLANGEAVALLKIPKSFLPFVSQAMHEKFHRCGGFIQHESLQEGLSLLDLQDKMIKSPIRQLNYPIDQKDLVEKLIGQLEKSKIKKSIELLSAYKSRFHSTATGKSSQGWVKTTWENMAQGRNDIQVASVPHKNTDQQSVVLTIVGSEKPQEEVVIGGHGDSINGFFLPQFMAAPGADDNASGIAVITELIRVLLQFNYQPSRTIHFISYAAEEVGLVGSKEIATAFKEKTRNVIGVLQLDMTNYKGSEYDIVIIEDHTSSALNKFLAALAETYLTALKVGYDKCGYACSDHASWTNAGFPAAIPFESMVKSYNPHIHTAKDTFDKSGNNADHALKFAKLSLAFVLELAK